MMKREACLATLWEPPPMLKCGACLATLWEPPSDDEEESLLDTSMG